IANTNIKNISASTALSSSFKSQMLGECLFWRAYFYFNLINYFGDVPLVVSPDVLETATLPKTPVAQVYDQIVKDLLDAKTKVSVNYPSADRARINKAVVSALLARVYLYTQKWSDAEAESTSLINSGGTYTLETNLNNVFIKTSNEVIWQVQSNVSAGITGVTKMGQNWIPSGTVPVFVLYDTLAKTFETGDQRKVNWTKSMVYNSQTFYYPYKYKIRVTSAAGNEFNVMFRLAEQYLIRAEARAQQSNFSGAQADINAIRSRAGLGAVTITDKNTALTALEKERWVELFTEWSDRWFNLKRTGRIDAVMKAVKPATWQPYQALYPIPLTDRNANPALKDNPGY
ncbi:MAG: RagB/SusD family nutrient uptake outer membrane protein, partial [Bacteroidetes bacterium]|nr:RagB/SusD family nutrient uptake outer membrane protein [Bacteroidota bacterium]